MFDVVLQWKEFNISLPSIKTWLQTNISTSFSGLSANSCLQIHFSEEPSQEEIDAINLYWDSITEESSEATSYESKDVLEVDRLVKVASAKAKLEALGLTADEIKALLG